jgi:hypothetical protein
MGVGGDWGVKGLLTPNKDGILVGTSAFRRASARERERARERENVESCFRTVREMRVWC